MRSLIANCLRCSDAASWRAFVACSERVITTAVTERSRRLGNTEDDVIDDLIQETYLRLYRDNLLKPLKADRHSGVDAFLHKIACEVVHDDFLAKRTQRRGGDSEHVPLQPAMYPDHRAEELFSERLLLWDVDGVLTEVAPLERDRRVFWLYYRIGMRKKAIASIPEVGLSVEGLERLLCSLTKAIRLRFRSLTNTSKDAQKGIHSELA